MNTRLGNLKQTNFLGRKLILMFILISFFIGSIPSIIYFLMYYCNCSTYLSIDTGMTLEIVGRRWAVLSSLLNMVAIICICLIQLSIIYELQSRLSIILEKLKKENLCEAPIITALKCSFLGMIYYYFYLENVDHFLNENKIGDIKKIASKKFRIGLCLLNFIYFIIVYILGMHQVGFVGLILINLFTACFCLLLYRVLSLLISVTNQLSDLKR